MAEGLLSARLGESRTGSGYDVHRFAPGDHVWLCGVKIPHDRALEGHSDADALLHAITDALLGAVANHIQSFEPAGEPEPWMTTIGHGPQTLPVRFRAA